MLLFEQNSKIVEPNPPSIYCSSIVMIPLFLVKNFDKSFGIGFDRIRSI